MGRSKWKVKKIDNECRAGSSEEKNIQSFEKSEERFALKSILNDWTSANCSLKQDKVEVKKKKDKWIFNKIPL